MRRLWLGDALEEVRKTLNSPFTKEIKEAPIPYNFQIQPIGTYDAKTDPIHHVRHYWHTML